MGMRKGTERASMGDVYSSMPHYSLPVVNLEGSARLWRVHLAVRALQWSDRVKTKLTYRLVLLRSPPRRFRSPQTCLPRSLYPIHHPLPRIYRIRIVDCDYPRIDSDRGANVPQRANAGW